MLLPKKAFDPGFWRAAPEKPYLKKILAVMHRWWEEECQGPLPEFDYAAFKLFFETGDRVAFEENYYFKVRRALNASALLSLVYPEEEKYFRKLQQVIFTVCNEYSWCLPAHFRPKGALVGHDPCRVDLFAAETVSALAEISVLFRERLDGFLLDLVKREADRRVVSHFTAHPETWEKSRSNWSAVCTAGVGCAVMHLFPERMEELLPRFDAAMECFLSGFSREGVCKEGVMYWTYGFGYFTVYADLLRSFTNGERDYFARRDVRNIASFFQKTFLSGNASVPFSDREDDMRNFQPALLRRLQELCPRDVSVCHPEYADPEDFCARWCFDLREFIWAGEFPKKQDSDIMEFFAPDAGWFLKREKTYGFCAKGGCNNEPHNHNDVGAFAFFKNGRQIVCDPGRGEYTRQYFDNELRYDHVETSSRGHSVPIIGGKLQKFGEQYAAKELAFERGVLSMDIAGAYGDESIRKVLRTLACAETTVTLSDTFDCDGAVVERIASFEEPKLCGNTVRIGEGKLTFDPSQASVSISSEPNTMNGKPIWFTDFALTGKTFALKME